MDDLERFIEEQKKSDPEFANGFESGYINFKIGILLRKAREEAGISQEQLAKMINTKKSAIARIENHAEDMRLSTLHRYADALGKKIMVAIA